MNDRSPRRAKRLGAGAGSLIEFLICFPVFLVLLIAMVDLGVNHGDDAQTRDAAVAAARALDAAQPTGDTTCSLRVPRDTPEETRRLFCLAKARSGQDPADVRVMVRYEGPRQLTAVVCVQSRAGSLSGLLAPFLNGRVHEAEARRSVAVLHTASATPPPPRPFAATEAPLPGHDWSFCGSRDAT